MRTVRSVLTCAAFMATIPAASWMGDNLGICRGSTCLWPVGLGLSAPSGVLMIGVALVLRDAVHERIGAQGSFALVVMGAALSTMFGGAAVAVASALAFLVGETADLLVYAPLRKRSRTLAVLASGVVGSAVDSVIFLWMAFGSLDLMAGQMLGKLWMTLAGALGCYFYGVWTWDDDAWKPWIDRRRS